MDKSCKVCKTLLTQENKRGNFCVTCYALRRKELKANRETSDYLDTSVVRCCIECNKPRDDAHHGRYCILCYNRRRTENKRSNVRGTVPTQLNENNQKECMVCKNMLDATYFRINRNCCKPCEYKYRREADKKAREENIQEVRRKKNEYNMRHKTSNASARLVANYRTRIWQVIQRPKNKSSMYLLGCDRDTFLKWIEFNFKPGMSMDNYGTYWHLDHVTPCAYYDLTNDENLEFCFHWSNIAPLEGHANIRKQDKIDLTLIEDIHIKAIEFTLREDIKNKGLTLLEPTVLKTYGNKCPA